MGRAVSVRLMACSTVLCPEALCWSSRQCSNSRPCALAMSRRGDIYETCSNEVQWNSAAGMESRPYIFWLWQLQPQQPETPPVTSAQGAGQSIATGVLILVMLPLAAAGRRRGLRGCWGGVFAMAGGLFTGLAHWPHVGTSSRFSVRGCFVAAACDNASFSARMVAEEPAASRLDL